MRAVGARCLQLVSLPGQQEAPGSPITQELIDLLRVSGLHLYGMIAGLVPGSEAAVICDKAGLTREFCLGRLRNRVQPDTLSPEQEEFLSSLPVVELPGVAARSGEVALRLAWQLCGHTEVSLLHLLEALLGADRAISRKGGAEQLLRKAGLWEEVHSSLPASVAPIEHGNASLICLSPAAAQVLARAIAAARYTGYQSEDLLRELSREAELWTSLGLNPDRVRSLISEFWG